MSLSTLAQIKKKVRRLTASPDPSQLTDSDIEEYIDTFYEQDLPAHLKLWRLRDKYTFYTEPNEDQYFPLLQWDLTFQPPCYVDGNEANYVQGQEDLYRLYPKQNFEEIVQVGDGSAVYSFTMSKTPMLKRHVTITADDQVLVDVPDASPLQTGTLYNANDIDAATGNINVAVGEESGTINYVTGVVTNATFPTVVSATTNIIVRNVPYVAARPRTVLFFNDHFEVRPVPDKAYPIEINTYKRPTSMLADSDNPEVQQWWQFIAFGAAIKVLQDRQDVESIQNIAPFFDEQKQLVLQRTVKQQTPQRTPTIYTEQASSNGGSQGFWG
jgi:hypothetical protein